MGDASWAKRRVARFQVQPFVPNLEDELTLKNVEIFILVKMNMFGRAALLNEGDLRRKERLAVLRRDFESNRAYPEDLGIACTVFAGWDH